MKYLKMKLIYLKHELEYIEYIIPIYKKKFEERLKFLNKTKLKFNCENKLIESSNIKSYDENLKKLYKKLIFKYHPDRNDKLNNDLISKFINDCYNKNNIELLQILEDLDELNELNENLEETFDDILKINEITKNIEIYKNSFIWIWNNQKSIRNNIENYYCTEEEYNELLILENIILKKEKQNLLNKIEKLKIPTQINNKETIEYLYNECMIKLNEMIEMKNISKSDIPYKNYEYELNNIKNLNYNEKYDFKDYENKLYIIKKYFIEQYWIYRKIFFSN